MYVMLHLALPDVGVQQFVPKFFPFPYFWNYFTGACILAFIVNGIIGKYDKLAALLMDEATRDFVFEGTWVTELSSFIHQKPAKESFKALEPVELLAISRDSFFKLVEAVPQFAHIYQKNLESSYTRSVERIGSFVSMDAEQRVRWLYENQPHLLTRLSNKAVASYLGISPETLSRMKARL